MDFNATHRAAMMAALLMIGSGCQSKPSQASTPPVPDLSKRVAELEAELKAERAGRAEAERKALEAADRLSRAESELQSYRAQAAKMGAEAVDVRMFQMLHETGGLAHFAGNYGMYTGQLVYIEGFAPGTMADEDVYRGQAVRRGTYSYDSKAGVMKTVPRWRVVRISEPKPVVRSE